MLLISNSIVAKQFTNSDSFKKILKKQHLHVKTTNGIDNGQIGYELIW